MLRQTLVALSIGLLALTTSVVSLALPEPEVLDFDLTVSVTNIEDVTINPESVHLVAQSKFLPPKVNLGHNVYTRQAVVYDAGGLELEHLKKIVAYAKERKDKVGSRVMVILDNVMCYVYDEESFLGNWGFWNYGEQVFLGSGSAKNEVDDKETIDNLVKYIELSDHHGRDIPRLAGIELLSRE